MAWQGIFGHDDVVERFRRSLACSRLASTFLFVGPPGVGKRTFAMKLAQALLCQARPPELLDPCGRCGACVQVLAGTHPDLEVISKPQDKSAIPVSVFIGDEGHRMREGLCHRIALKPFMGGKRIAIIDDADALNEEGANALLKTLEEPPPQSLLILIGTSADKQLPTIRSRCQIVRFRPLPAATVAQLLLENQLVGDAEAAQRAAAFSDGSLERAMELADPELWKFREYLLSQLAQERFDSVELGKALGAFVDEAGKEASLRRSRTRQVIGFAVEFYRQLLRAVSGLEPVGDAALSRGVEKALSTWRGDEEAAAACLDRCLAALGHIDRNANQATLIECWADDLGLYVVRGPWSVAPTDN
jgi:DNA polymerase-3 subunit delta'